MILKNLSQLGKFKSCATITFSFYDLFEFLHKPWQGHELILVFVLLLWFLLIKIPVFILMNFNKKLPLIFNEERTKFALWLMYFYLASISIIHLLFSVYNEGNLELFLGKSVIVIVILIWDWKETNEAIKKIVFP